MMGLLFPGMLEAQRATIIGSQSSTPFHAEAAPNTVARHSGPAVQSTAGVTALWDTQFAFSSTDSAAGDAGMAAAIWFNNEFWVSRWASDTLYRFSATGSLISEFTIVGLTGTRGLTTDGTSLFAGTSSNTIFQINPTTQTVTGTINSAAPVTARHISYDPTLNSGGGGFWIGNFNTDIVAIDMNGAVLSTITAATHGLTGMYGSAYDSVSTGGPYLWVFNQGGPNSCSVDQISLPSGTPTGLTRDVFLDFAPTFGLTSGLAGGLFITDQFVTGQNSIGGMIQGTPGNVLFVYELSDPTPSGPDANLDNVSAGGYTIIPETQATSLVFSADVTNVSQGATTINSATVDFTVTDGGGGVVFTDQQTVTNLAPNSITPVTSAPFTSATIDNYDISAIVTLGGGQQDTFPNNDSAAAVVEVNDTLYSRDDGFVGGSLSIGGGPQGNNGFIGQEFDIINNDTITGVGFWLDGPTLGDSITAVIIPMGPVGPAGAPIGSTDPYFITAADTGGNFIELDFIGGVPVTAGTAYFVGLEESVTGALTLGTSPNIFTEDKGWVFFNGTWSNSEDFNFFVAYILRPIFSTPTLVSIDNRLDDEVLVFPNPSRERINVAVTSSQHSDLDVVVFDLQGRKLIESVIPANTTTTRLNVSELASGYYILEVRSPEGRHVQRISVQ